MEKCRIYSTDIFFFKTLSANLTLFMTNTRKMNYKEEVGVKYSYIIRLIS